MWPSDPRRYAEELLLIAKPVIYAYTVLDVVELLRLKVIVLAAATATVGLIDGAARRPCFFCIARTSSRVVMVAEILEEYNKWI